MKVTDPDLLAKLNAPTKVTDPKILAELNGETPGFVDRVGADFVERNNQAKQILANRASGQTGNISAVLQGVGGVGAGLMNDVAGEALKSVGNGISSVTPDFVKQPVKQAASDVYSYLENSPVGTVAHNAIQGYRDFAQENPNASKNIEAATNLGLLFVPGSRVGGKSVAGAAIDTVGAGSKGVGKTLLKPVNALSDRAFNKSIDGTRKGLQQSAAAERSAASDLYKVSEAENVQFSQPDLNVLNKNLSSLIPKTDAEVRVWKNSGASSHVNDLVESIATEPMTLNGALAQRTALNDSISAAARAGKNGEVKKLMDVKEALDKTMMNPDTATWQAANHSWAKAATKQDLADMVVSAEGKAQPANSLDTAINNYLKSWKGKALKPEERAALEDVVKKSAGGELLKSVSGRLINHVAAGVGAGVGGVPGAIAGHLIGTYGAMFARDVAMMNKIKKLDKVFEAIEARTPPPIKAQEFTRKYGQSDLGKSVAPLADQPIKPYENKPLLKPKK